MGKGPEIKTNGLLNKVKDRLMASKSYALADGRKESRERLYRKLKGQYYSQEQMTDGKDRVKVENVAGLTYQMRPSYHLRRPHISLEAKTPKFITEIAGKRHELNNVKNSKIAELAVNQELDAIEVEGEVNAMLQDWLCPYEFGAVKVGCGDRTLFSHYDVDKVNPDGVWALRTCPDDIFVDWQANGRRSIGYYFHAIHKPVQWIKDNKDFNPKGRAGVSADKTPEFLRSRLKNDAATSSYDMGTIYEYHDLETGQIAVVSESGSDWLLDPYGFPYSYKGPQFVFLIPMPLNNDFYGRCYTSLVEPQIDETNSFRTRAMRILKRFPVVNFFKTGAWTPEQQRQWASADDAENIEVVDPSGIDTRAIPGLPADFWRMMEVVERDMEKVGSTSAMRRGEVTAVKPTTAQIIEGHGNLRDADVREEVAGAHQQIAMKVLDLMIQYYDTPRWVKLTGGMSAAQGLTIEDTEAGPFALYTNKEIAGNYDFKPDVQSMVPVNNEMKANVINNTLKLVPTLPTDVQQKFHRKYDISELIYDSVKMQGVELSKYERPEDEDVSDDPWEENELVLKGGLLKEPGDNEPHRFHGEVHKKVLATLAVNPSDPRFIELARHNRWHELKEANQKTPIAAPNQPMLPGASGIPGSGPVQPPVGGVPGGIPQGPAMPPQMPLPPAPGGMGGNF